MKELENKRALNEIEMAKVAGGYNPLVYSPFDGLPDGISEQYDEMCRQRDNKNNARPLPFPQDRRSADRPLPFPQDRRSTTRPLPFP